MYEIEKLTEELIKELMEFFLKNKFKNLDTNEIVSFKIDKYLEKIKQLDLKTKYYDNYLIILGYTQRLEKIDQKIYFTFLEAINAIDFAKQTNDKDSIELNCIVYILVMKNLIDEFNGIINKEEKILAFEKYNKMQEQKNNENKKYYMYQ